MVEAADQFLGQMRGVAGAAAVAAGQDFAAGGQPGGQGFPGFFHRRQEAAEILQRGAERIQLLGGGVHKFLGNL